MRNVVFSSLRPVRLALVGLLWLSLPGPACAIQEHGLIQGFFKTSRDVTVKCLECHEQQARAALQTVHWKWAAQRTINGESVSFGKKDALTGFAIDVSSNPRCMTCHISNTAPQIDFADPDPAMVDCLLCHDTTGRYLRNVRISRDAQQTDLLELAELARSVGLPEPENCLSCHFADCGLSSAAADDAGAHASSPADIHLQGRSAISTCQMCHPGSGHKPAAEPGQDQGSASGEVCFSCHREASHSPEILNRHLAAISCRTCHIPQFAGQEPALLGWNWLMTGKTSAVFQAAQGLRHQIHDRNGIWSAAAVEPAYLWDNGGDDVYTRGQRIRPRELTFLQRPAARSPVSKIAPFRVIYGTQLYDARYRYLISPRLSETEQAYFPEADWDSVARLGMEAVVLPYSGEYGFAPTAIYRRINHGVVPAEQALGCLDCHGSRGRINWQMLGYESDPWHEIRTDEKESAVSTREQVIPAVPLY